MKRALGVILGLLVLFGLAFEAKTVIAVNGDGMGFDFRETSDTSAIHVGMIVKEGGGISVGYDTDKSAAFIKVYDSNSVAIDPSSGSGYVDWTLNNTEEVKAKFMVSGGSPGSRKFHVVGFWVLLDDGRKFVIEFTDYGTLSIHGLSADQIVSYSFFNITRGVWVERTFNLRELLENKGVELGSAKIKAVRMVGGAKADDSTEYIYFQYLLPATYNVQFSLKDALSGQPLTGVTVKDTDGTFLGTIDDGESLELTKGTHTLTFEKQGYWSTSITIDVQGDMNVSVELYPDSAAFMFKNFPSSIEVYENSIYELTFTLSPISTQATYNTYLSLSGLTDVIEVRKDGQLVSPESGKYYLGDISADTQITIKFKVTTVGTKAFSIILTSNDAIMSKTYTTSKQVTYEVVPLPFSIQLPDWTVGENSLRIAESSGQDMVLTLSLKDSEGNEVWSDSYSFGPYESHEFTVGIPKEGVYTLEIQFSGTTAIFDINVNPPIQLLTDSITVGKGDVGAIQLLVKNPSSLTKYYEVVLTGGFIEGNITKAIAVAPASEKTVEIAFQVPKNLTFDAYDLTVEVYEGDDLIYKDIVHAVIDNSGFSLPIGSGGSTLSLALGALVLIGGIIYVLRRR